MFRPSSTVIILMALSALFLPVRSAAGDDVAAYLERLGLTELLASHLEKRLEETTGEERGELLIRLASIYAQLLETIDDSQRREGLEERGRRLLASAPEGAANELRLALLRASYRAAEKIAENHRLRLSTDEELERARNTLAGIIPELNRLRQDMERDVEVIDRRFSRSSGARSAVLSREVEEASQLQSQCAFLTAWALYYQSWLNDRSDNAFVAQDHFAELLGFGEQSVRPEDVSVDLRSVEAIARCILGMALCKSLTASSATAISWIELLEHPRSYEPLWEQTPAWKIVIYLENDEYLEVRAVLDEYVEAGKVVPLHWLRLIAVYSLERQGSYRQAQDLARYAVTELGARGELKQVFDLAERYGVDSLGTSGFALLYVKGALKYYQARERHGDDEPTEDAEIRRVYGEARAEIESALLQHDASSYPGVLPDCIRLKAWCAYFRNELRTAKNAFEEAADRLPANEAAEAQWMAVICMDKLATANESDSAVADELALLIERFLEEYPSSEHAPKLVLRRSLTTKEISSEIADELLAIPSNSDAYDAARRRAAQILYRLFREAEPAQRVGYGTKYLSIATALLAAEERDLDLNDPLDLPRYLVRSRRILEVALHGGIRRQGAAQSVLESLDELFEQSSIDIGEIRSEIECRRVQERLLADEPEAAQAIADSSIEEDPAGIWTKMAVRSIFKFARNQWRDAKQEGTDDRRAVAMVVRYGARVLNEYSDDPESMQHPGVQAYHASVADASMLIWQRSGEAQQGRYALTLFEKLLQVRPRNSGFLRSVAILAGGLGENERATECWRTIVAGSPQGTDAWYEAKYNVIRLLAGTDAVRARAVLNQHKQLNPNYGPHPWGAKLKAIDWELDVTVAEDPGDDDGDETGMKAPEGES